ncbi:MAG: U32 family peptidase, partial [Gemmatimonadetes bacterium]|nr:U32 family peptidase [Gemmatimonadota bacterium]
PCGVFELYGKLPSDVVGGGRATFMLAPTSRRALERHVSACRQAGLGFNYLLNAACLDNLEYTRGGQRRIRRLLDWLNDIGVSAVTVANPFLLRLIKAGYPKFEVRVSVFAAVNDVRRARYWEDLGADRITLDSLQINREFDLLRKIREAVRCRLELLASNSCIQSCPLQPYHPNLLSHASQRGHRTRGFAIDWCLVWCSYMKIRDPVNYLRADWVRPEDIEHYEALGYDEFKLTERNAPTEILVLRARAYHERRYNGNLLDLVQPYGFPVAGGKAQRRGLRWVASHFLRTGTVRWRKLPLLYRLAQRRGLLGYAGTPVYIDNRALDGFIQRFLTQGCRERDCETCRYCHAWAEKAVCIDEAWRAECLALYEAAFGELESGGLWRT